MPYYLHHYFAPDFNHKRLRPMAMADGTISAHYLGYVHNVVAGQVLAELLPVPTATPAEDSLDDTVDMLLSLGGVEYDPRYIYDTPVFPMGPNCGHDPENPNRIIALANGYCFYHQGLITVKKMLNVRQDVNFHTGNIFFVGDVVAHGDVYPGFSLCGSDILVKGRIDGGIVKAKGKIICESGVKGAPTALLQAGSTIRTGFCEAARIITNGNLIIDGSCIHCDLYVGGSLIVKGRLQGGSVHANGLVYVKEQLGNAQAAPTRISLGYNPMEYLAIQEISEKMQIQKQKIKSYEGRIMANKIYAEECNPLIEVAQRKLDVITQRRERLLHNFQAESHNEDYHRIIVPGTVHPGVEISIGKAYRKLIAPQADVFFTLQEDEVIHGMPALAKPIHTLSTLLCEPDRTEA